MTAAKIFSKVELYKSSIKSISDFIYNNPELGYHETQAAGKQIDFLAGNGFEVETPCGSLDTAFKAKFGHGSPHVAILSEYDALPDIGHACGHNLIAASALTAGIAVKEIMSAENLPGTLYVIGTPGEESLGGKAIMLKNGVFDSIDMALISHPYSETMADQGALAVSRFDIEFLGESSHAATAPDEGKNALDAMTLFFNGINAWRQHLPDSSRVHGIIKKGGNVPNIIPDYTLASFYLRSKTLKEQVEMERRIEQITRGAALMTNTDYRLIKQPNSYHPILVNSPINEYFFKNAHEFGLDIANKNPQGMISTDFGNVSQVVPGANWFFKITGNGAPLHTEPFKADAGTDFAFDQAVKIGAAMAATVIEALTDGGFMKKVKDDFDRNNN